jgi:hypothetical protein
MSNARSRSAQKVKPATELAGFTFFDKANNTRRVISKGLLGLLFGKRIESIR